jgi:hypothetical protein
MSFVQRWDADQIIRDLHACNAEASSLYNDGFTGWGCKKDLLRVKYALDEMLASTPNFSHVEEEFHKEMAKQQTWSKLNDRNL